MAFPSPHPSVHSILNLRVALGKNLLVLKITISPDGELGAEQQNFGTVGF